MKLLQEVVASPGLDVVRIVCLDSQGKVLLVQETDDINWKLPGGKMHEHETVLAAIQREVLEELGCAVSADQITKIVKKHIPDSPNFRYIIRASLDIKSIRTTSEVAQYEFFALTSLPESTFRGHISSAVQFVS